MGLFDGAASGGNAGTNEKEQKEEDSASAGSNVLVLSAADRRAVSEFLMGTAALLVASIYTCTQCGTSTTTSETAAEQAVQPSIKAALCIEVLPKRRRLICPRCVHQR